MYINILQVLRPKNKYTLCICLIIPFFCFSQIEKNNDEYTKIDTLIEVYKLLQQDNKIQVYSIQINSHESLEKVQLNQKKYTKIFPVKISEIIFEAPEYKLITGTHIDQKSAEKVNF